MSESQHTDGDNVGQKNVDPENMDQDSTARFLHSLSDSLDQSVDSLDVSTLARLHVARREVLAADEKQRRPAWLMPVGSLAVAATVAVLTVSVWLVPPNTAVDGSMPSVEDIALLSDSEALEFYENLDFYLWLDEQNKAG